MNDRHHGFPTLALALAVAGCAASSATFDVDERSRLISAAQKSGNPEFAMLIARRHVEESPDNLTAHMTYGGLLVELRQCDRALPVLRRARLLMREHGPASHDDHVRALTRNYLQCQNFNEVVRLARQHEEHTPDDADMLNMKGVALDNLGAHVEAQAAYRKALSLRSSQKIAYNLALSQLLSGQVGQGLSTLEQLRADDFVPDMPERSLVILESLALALEGRKDEARTLLSSVVSAEQAETLLSRVP